MGEAQLTTVRDATERAGIVFMHGFGGDAAATWGRFPYWLQQDKRLASWGLYTLGYSTHLRIDFVKLWSADPALGTVAKRLATEAQHGKLGQLQSLCLVAHSMGGLAVQRALLDDQQLAERTSHVFLFGTPSAGLAKASWARCLKPQLRDMASESPFILELRRDWAACFHSGDALRTPFQFFAIAGERDEFVPYESSLQCFSAALYKGRCWVVPGNHIEMVKPAAADSQSVTLLLDHLLGDAAPRGPWDAARLAIQSRDFAHAAALFESRAAELDQEGAVQLALALEGIGRADDAIEVLAKRSGNETDAMGVLAGRLKRRWLLSHIEADGESALRLYTSALESPGARVDDTQAYYHAINVAFMQLAFKKDRAVAEAYAQKALDKCASSAAGELPHARQWRLATQGEAHLMLGRNAQSLQSYRDAVSMPLPPTPREMRSMYQQAVYLSWLLADEEYRLALTEIFRPQPE
ncbi:MAG: tetratricopeptide repeat-containing protein [Betaproteobacteria bacterium]